MANVSTAARPIRLKDGGQVYINDGTNVYKLVVREPSTMRVKEGFYEAVTYKDRGEQQIPLEGDEVLSEIDLDLKFTGADDAAGAGADLYNVLKERDTTTGLMKVFTIQVWIPDKKGDTNGSLGSIANCFLREGLEFQEGEQFDMLRARFQSTEPQVTWTSAAAPF